jgi:hypothetical protein
VGKYKITIENEEFTSSEEQEAPDQETVRKKAVAAALAVASDQVAAGKPFFGAQVTIDEGGAPLLRLIVSAGASPLKMG